MSDSIIELDRAEEVAGLPCAAGVPAVTEATWRQHRPAVHVAAMRDGVCVARCSLWMQQTPTPATAGRSPCWGITRPRGDGAVPASCSMCRRV